jgi:hypothetical protein
MRRSPAISAALIAVALAGAAVPAMAPVAEAQTIIVACSTPALVTAFNTANARSTAPGGAAGRAAVSRSVFTGNSAINFGGGAIFAIGPAS